MAVYLVTWELNDKGVNYNQARNRFLTGFNGLDVSFDPKLDSVRFVSTNLTADGLNKHLAQYANMQDRIMVVKMNRPIQDHQGQLGPAVWEWINARN